MPSRVAVALAFACAVLVALVLPRVTASAFEDLCLRPRWADPAQTLDSVSMDQRLERIDLLTDSLAVADGAARDSMLVRIVRLYRRSPLMKHRVLALEWGDSLQGTDHLRERVFNLRRSFNPWDARESLAAWKASDPDAAAPHRRDGLIALEESSREAHRLDDARRHFEAATRCPDATLDDWLGLAVVHVTRADYPALAAIVEPLLERGGDAPGPHLLAAIAFESEGLSGRASREFDAAFALMSRGMRERFEFPHALVVRSGADLYGSALIERPEPPSVRGWWARLTEAEVQFSDPDAGQHAWETGPGEVYLLFGRPIYARAFSNASNEELTMPAPLAPYANTILGQRGARDHLYGDETLVWLVRLRDDRQWPIVFQSLTRFTRWVPSPIAREEILDPQTKAGPVGMARSLPEPRDPAGFDLAVRSVGFRTAAGELRIESWVAIDGESASPTPRVRFRLLDALGRVIDRREHDLDDRRSRRTIREIVPNYPARARGWLHGFGALVPAGRYTAVVEVVDAEGTVLAARDQALRLAASAENLPPLDMSELLLCDVYAEDLPLRELPPEGVRHARVVLPHPETSLHPGQRSVDVYYEVYGAEVDSTNRTRLDVEYEVYPSWGFDPYVGGGAYVRGELIHPILRAHFPDERTGRSWGGMVVKGTRIDMGNASPGRYVLLVRVGDRLARSEVTRILQFELP